MILGKRTTLCLIAAGLLTTFPCHLRAQSGEPQRLASEHHAGDAPADPGPLATDLSPALKPAAIHAAMRKVADWQVAREEGLSQPGLDLRHALRRPALRL